MPQQLASLILDMVEVKGEKVKGKRQNQFESIHGNIELIMVSIMTDLIITSKYELMSVVLNS
jgi:hypothetical protein